jgi:hypothetical protein
LFAKNAAGEKLSSIRVVNDLFAIAAAVAEAGPSPEVVIEATYGGYWIVDWLQEQGATVHLANPSGLNWGTRLVRWAVIEGTIRDHGGGKLAADFHQIAERRGKNKAIIAIARKELTLVYYGLRDEEVRCLAKTA